MTALPRPTAALSILCYLALSAAAALGQTCLGDCSASPITLGIVVPTDGPLRTFGRQALIPAEIAVREINAAGGLAGSSVTLDVGNDRCDPGSAIEVARRQIAQAKIKAVIGSLCPEAARITAPIYSNADVIQFLPTVSTVGFVRQNLVRLFRMIASDEQEAKALGDFMRRQQMGKSLAVVFTDAFYRRQMAELIKANLPAEMQPRLQLIPLIDTSGAYDRLVDQLKRHPPDVIYMAIDNAMIFEFVGKLRKRGVMAHLVGGQRLNSQALLVAARKLDADIQIIAPIAAANSPEFKRTSDLFDQAGVVPDLVALNTYAAVQTWGEAVRRAGGAEPDQVATIIRSQEFQTIIGRVAFDQRGARRDVDFSTLTLREGRLSPAIDAHQ